MIQKPHLKKSDGTWVKSNQKKANIFADHMENNFQPHEIKNVEEYLAITEIPNSTIQLVTPKEVKT